MFVIATIGLPASGKSTWAKHLVRRSNGTVKRINKDDLRAMLDAGEWSAENEALVEIARNALIESFLSRGFSVVCDDTNFHPSHIATFEGFAVRYKARFILEDFRDVPLEECIRRDGLRDDSVGETVIRSMHARYMA